MEAVDVLRQNGQVLVLTETALGMRDGEVRCVG
jgi:hypothetical protein